MHLHAAELIHVHWTREIEAEWTRNVVAKQGADADDIQACLRGMRDAADGWEVAGYAKYQALFEQVDPKDRHVAAAAYKLSLADWPGQRVALVTRNVKDFPARAFAGTELMCYPMGAYLGAWYEAEPAVVARVAEGCRKKLKAPPLTRERYVAVLMVQGCVVLAQGLAQRWSVECPQIAKDGTLFYESDLGGKKPASRKVSKAKP